MIKPNIKYLAFDDRLLFFIGVPTVTFLLPLVFWDVSCKQILEHGLLEFVESMMFTMVYWLIGRKIVIELRKRYHQVEHTRKRLFLQAIIVTPIVPIVGICMASIFTQLYAYFGVEDAFNPSKPKAFAATYFVVLTCFLLYDTIYFVQKYREAIIEKNQLQLAHVQGQLENLRNQINPHFLFNSLNTLMNLIPLDPDRAMNYLDKLSRFYRYAVSNQKQTLTLLHTELEIAVIFTDLLRERFQDAIHVVLPKIENHQAKVLPLSLQLLIENAVKHNIVSNKKPLTVHVEFDETKQYIWVRNNIQKKIQEVSSTGMGLKNIQKRFAFFTDRPVLVEETEQQFSVGLPYIFNKKNPTPFN